MGNPTLQLIGIFVYSIGSPLRFSTIGRVTEKLASRNVLIYTLEFTWICYLILY